uniref:Transposase n=1 Tax=Ascaris lumbricoides TaxID=6252 RepID=A0A0M3I9T6_ASCLU
MLSALRHYCKERWQGCERRTRLSSCTTLRTQDYRTLHCIRLQSAEYGSRAYAVLCRISAAFGVRSRGAIVLCKSIEFRMR